jgi:hypothetical protein
MDLNEIVFSLVHQSGLKPEKDANLSSLIALIGQKNPELEKLLKSYKNAKDAYEFIKSDHELRHKVKEIWEMHRIRTKEELQKSQSLLADFCSASGLVIEFNS